MDSVVINGTSIDIHEGPIGITMSGGADSSLLFYILMKYAKGPIHVNVIMSESHGWSQINSVNKVVIHCMKEFKREDVYVHIAFTNYYLHKIKPFFTMGVFDWKLYNTVYIGLTAAPPIEVSSTFTGLEVHQRINSVDRDPLVERKNYLGEGGYIYAPFFNIDKQKIRAMYEELGVLDTLFPLTRSCEDKETVSGHCGKCWWCCERKWAFGRYE